MFEGKSESDEDLPCGCRRNRRGRRRGGSWIRSIARRWISIRKRRQGCGMVRAQTPDPGHGEMRTNCGRTSGMKQWKPTLCKGCRGWGGGQGVCVCGGARGHLKRKETVTRKGKKREGFYWGRNRLIQTNVQQQTPPRRRVGGEERAELLHLE